MRIGMVQMAMSNDLDLNEKKILTYCDAATGCDLLFFPEIQYSPFFPQYPKQDAEGYAFGIDDPKICRLKEKAREHKMYFSPNIYLADNKNRYDASLWINPNGQLAGISKMVHILNADKFFEQDYYTPSDEGFQVYDTEFGRIGVVICFDRHLPESIRSCALQGADLVIIPTANHKGEPLEMFEWEIRVQAMQNQVFIAMCNRVGPEGEIMFAGESLLVHPSGDTLFKADGREQLITWELDLSDAANWKEKRPFLSLRRPHLYL